MMHIHQWTHSSWHVRAGKLKQVRPAKILQNPAEA